ncbi:MAG: heavy-metal-associated domain-containing protein [Erythrobacter sp.]|uniref:heavy-metal-associated domain-containing protein n=1 Tax=Erythrobacter sp. TaxID=1042 RepID=UPI00329888B3
MTAISHPSGPISRASFRARWVVAIVLALVFLAGGYALVLAQVSGDRGIAPTASSADIEVRGIEVDVTGDNAADARSKGWREAARKAWAQAGGPAVSDDQLSGYVAAIVIQRERLGPKRYVATLGVSFDRQRAGRILGGARSGRSSAPMLLMPVVVSGGSYTAFEVRNPWQRAWAQFNPGTSRIDYVRPTGAGGDSLHLNFGQAGRRSRAWWRLTLDQYGAADALIPIAKLDHQFPGGPITGTFTARYGPDSLFLDSFTLNAKGPSELPKMLGEAVDRVDRIYEQALVDGKLQPDPTLRVGGSGQVDPAIARLIEIGRAIEARDRAQEQATAAAISPETPRPNTQTPVPTTAALNSFTIQFATPDPMSFDANLSSVRQVPGIRGVSVTSTAMGGTSVMRVSFAGELSALAAELRSRGFAVNEGANALAISR